MIHKAAIIYCLFTFSIVNSVLAQANALCPQEQKEIARCEKYSATAGSLPATVWILARPSDAVIGMLQAKDELDSIGNVGSKAVFSHNGDYISYSVGTASSGHEIRLQLPLPLIKLYKSLSNPLRTFG